MIELTISDKTYAFNADMGFLREVSKLVTMPLDGMKGADIEQGLQYAVTMLSEGSVEWLGKVLLLMNLGKTPRVSQSVLDKYFEDETTDIDALFKEVLDFLSKANVTRRQVAATLERLQKGQVPF